MRGACPASFGKLVAVSTHPVGAAGHHPILPRRGSRLIARAACLTQCPLHLQGFGVHHALNPDPYRGVFGNDGPAYARGRLAMAGLAGAGMRD